MNKTGLILDAGSLQDLKELAIRAEQSDFHSIWATELFRSSFQQLAAVSQVTSKIILGTSVSLAFVRSPLITSLTALDLDELSRGRLIIGIGSGAKRTNEKFHGVVHGKPVQHIKESLELIRSITTASHKTPDIKYSGEYYDIDMRGYRRPFKPVRDKIPIYLAGIGPGMCLTAGEYADGYIGHVVCTPEYLNKIVIPSVISGLEKSGRSKEYFNITSIITCAVSDDIKSAKRAAKATIAFYALVKTYQRPFRLHGFLPQTKRIRESYFKKDLEGMIKNVSDEMVDTFAVVGDREYCLDKINEYREFIDLPVLSAPHYFIDFDEVSYYQNNILEVFGKSHT